jgi:cytochrome c oxidase cbb3-type subunit III
MKARAHPAALALLAASLALACEREQRLFDVDPSAAQAVVWRRQTAFQAGAGHAVGDQPPLDAQVTDASRYQENSHAMQEGKRFFAAYNCVGCHSHGGGGMGPPLMHDQWLYGGEPAQIFATIVEGRPNGMPSFGGRVPADQVWQLAAYVRSLAGLAPFTAAPGRDDDLEGPPPENTRDRPQPKGSEGKR